MKFQRNILKFDINIDYNHFLESIDKRKYQ